jgi:hypothetical protein
MPEKLTKRGTVRKGNFKGGAQKLITRVELPPDEWLSDADARKLYTKYRDIAQKRVKRLVQGGYINEKEAEMYNRRMPTLKNQKNVRAGLEELRTFLNQEKSSAKRTKALQKEIAEGWERAGYSVDIPKGVQSKRKFGHFMDYMKKKYKGRQYDSSRAVRLYVAIKNKGLDPENFRKESTFFMDNIDVFEAIPKQSGKGKSSRYFKKLINSL